MRSYPHTVAWGYRLYPSPDEIRGDNRLYAMWNLHKMDEELKLEKGRVQRLEAQLCPPRTSRNQLDVQVKGTGGICTGNAGVDLLAKLYTERNTGVMLRRFSKATLNSAGGEVGKSPFYRGIQPPTHTKIELWIRRTRNPYPY